jgi:hypothetical protein
VEDDSFTTMARMLSRVAGRLLTGPVAFLVATLIDFAVLGVQTLTKRS